MGKVLACYSPNIQWVIVTVQEQVKGSTGSWPGKNRRKTLLPPWQLWADCPLLFQLALTGHCVRFICKLGTAVSSLPFDLTAVQGVCGGTLFEDGVLGCLSGVWLLLVLLNEFVLILIMVTYVLILLCSDSLGSDRCHTRSLCLSAGFCSLWYKPLIHDYAVSIRIRKAVQTSAPKNYLSFFLFLLLMNTLV